MCSRASVGEQHQYGQPSWGPESSGVVGVGSFSSTWIHIGNQSVLSAGPQTCSYKPRPYLSGRWETGGICTENWVGWAAELLTGAPKDQAAVRLRDQVLLRILKKRKKTNEKAQRKCHFVCVEKLRDKHFWFWLYLFI